MLDNCNICKYSIFGMNSKLDEIKKILEAVRIRPTFIRLKVMEFVYGNRTHPTAEIIYRAVKKEVPTVCRSSVYNALNLFTERGVLGSLTLTGLETRFDCTVVPHHHFFCRYCRRVWDLDVECPNFKRRIQGFMVEEVHAYFVGICEECQENREPRGGVDGKV